MLYKMKPHKMKKITLTLLSLGILAIAYSQDKIKDNQELIEIYKNDQADRQTDEIDWKIVSKRDSLRELRIYQLLDSNQVHTSKDFHNAAMIFQHGVDSTAYGMAVKLMRKSIELDSTANKWLLAAAIDRYLLSKDEPQIYGTQYKKFGKDEPWQLGKMDTTKISDAERIEYGVETLAQQKERVKQMNRKKLSELLTNGKNIEEIVLFIKADNKNKAEYDISESGINNFGYNLLGQGQKKEALKIFKLNTELYPNGFNTWDSYGECLLMLGNKEGGINAYKKSLELNPKNRNAETIIEQNK
jgi:tetratricopeptide (TPR) repeat protein